MKKSISLFLRARSVVTLVFIVLLAISCDFKGGRDEDECENSICTLIYISLNVEVVNSNNDPIALDNYTVTDTQNGRNLTPDFSNIPFENMQTSGSYTFFSDSWLND